MLSLDGRHSKEVVYLKYQAFRGRAYNATKWMAEEAPIYHPKSYPTRLQHVVDREECQRVRRTIKATVNSKF